MASILARKTQEAATILGKENNNFNDKTSAVEH